jgi:TatD DNase family protein
MLETDGPYLAPVPHRGKRNEPALLTHTRDRIAELRGTSADQVEEETATTARSFFSLDLPFSAS